MTVTRRKAVGHMKRRAAAQGISAPGKKRMLWRRKRRRTRRNTADCGKKTENGGAATPYDAGRRWRIFVSAGRRSGNREGRHRRHGKQSRRGRKNRGSLRKRTAGWQILSSKSGLPRNMKTTWLMQRSRSQNRGSRLSSRPVHQEVRLISAFPAGS